MNGIEIKFSRFRMMLTSGKIRDFANFYNIRWSLGLSRLCSATFGVWSSFLQLGATPSNLEQRLSFWAFFQQYPGLEHILSAKKSTILKKTSIYANFLNNDQPFESSVELGSFKCPHIIWQDVKWTLCQCSVSKLSALKCHPYVRTTF